MIELHRYMTRSHDLHVWHDANPAAVPTAQVSLITFADDSGGIASLHLQLIAAG
jgi:hypothetical protein